MGVMVQFYFPRVARSWPQWRKLRMVIVEIFHHANILRSPGFGLKIGVALGATSIVRVSQPQRAFMLQMARAASRSKRGALEMMSRCVVACQASFVANFVAKN